MWMKCKKGLVAVWITLCASIVLCAGVAPAAEKVSDEKTFIAELEKTMNKRDPSFLDRHMDFDAMVSNGINSIDASDEMKKGFRKGVMGKAKQISLGKQIISAMGGKGSYHFMRMRKIGGQELALFRLLPGTGGVNYHGFAMTKGKSGEIMVSDFYNFMSGELMSETMRRAFLTAVSSQKNLVSRFIGKDAEMMHNLPKVQEMQKLFMEKKPKEVLKVYDSLPKSVQREKNVILLAMLSAASTDDARYEKTIDLYHDTFPGDPSLDLISIDGLVLKKKYADAVKAINRLDKSVGGDPYQGVLRANMYMLDHKYSDAKESAEKAVKEEPTLIDGYWTLVTISLDEKDYKETARLLTVIEKERHIKLNNLKGTKQYAGFVKAPEYKEWMQGRGKK